MISVKYNIFFTLVDYFDFTMFAFILLIVNRKFKILNILNIVSLHTHTNFKMLLF